MTDDVRHHGGYSAAVQVYDPPAVGLNPQDLVETGAQYATSGLTTLEARALVAEMQQLAAQVAMAMSPKIMEKIRKVQAARVLEMQQRVMLLPNYMGHVNRASVLAIIQDIASRVPQQ